MRDVLEQFVRMLDGVGLLRRRSAKAEAARAASDPLVDDRVQRLERAAADEEHIRGIDLDEVLVWVLAPALRRNVGHRALDDLEQRLLDALSRDITRNRRVVPRLTPDLIDLIDVDDSAFRLGNIEVGRLNQAQENVLDIFSYVPRLRERRRVRNRERDV